ncbi:MAG: ribosomal protein S18-alanine N-acetyltransferase [Acidobacteria bacterium]|nr:ribosomal protein S18-alanine N-acetyltransferase [Acidobacteriota bacterium]
MNASEYAIEVATEADLDAISEIDRASFTNPWTRDMFARELRQPQLARLYVIRAPCVRVAGFCVCWDVVREVHLNTLAIRPDLRRRGLGTLMLRHVLREAAERGARRATLDVRVSNDAALALYRALGFEIAATRGNYYSNPAEPAYILWHEHVERFLEPQGP